MEVFVTPPRETSLRQTPPPHLNTGSHLRRTLLGLGLLLFLVVMGWLGFRWYESLLSRGTAGALALERGAGHVRAGEWALAGADFTQARAIFDDLHAELRFLDPITNLLARVPGLSRVASGSALVTAGVHLGESGERIERLARIALVLPGATASSKGHSLLALMQAADPDIIALGRALEATNVALGRVSPEHIPLAKRAHFVRMREELPSATAAVKLTSEHLPLFEELLGGFGPRKYLFLFQNNHEMRPTGGFIGSYARLDLTNGKIRQFFIDGIFNPDGQLKENIVPPEPIQKVSAGWSLHDSNWFPDFPMSAEKAIFFYEKTGGPTVDGVVAMTPTILGKLLTVTGPIALPEYGVTIDTDNFMEVVQEEVEVKYDREENAPKKILSDLATAIFERLLAVPDMTRLRAVGEAFVGGLNERHILLYSRHPETQQLIEVAGWSGGMLSAPHDFLAVIHANINGYKTDGVIDEDISHSIAIESDGAIVDTVAVTRRHRGGTTPYAWWNKVNADYLRVYVPLGSTLLSAEGMTRETVRPPLDYDALGFRRDPDVTREEGAVTIDEATGTRIGVDAGKTVFGNWVYVSPGESVTVTYRYRLPFRFPLERLRAGEPASHSVLYQKQSGAERVTVKGGVTWPAEAEVVWQTGGNLIRSERTIQYSVPLEQNQFYGWVFRLSGEESSSSLPR